MTHAPNLDNAHLLLIGRLAVAAGQIEGTMAHIAAALVSPHPSGVGYATVATRQFSQLADLASAVIQPQLNSDGSPASDLLAPLTEWIVRARTVMRRRNQLMHAVWMIYAPQGTATLLRRTGETEDLSTGQMLSDVEAAEEVAWVGGDLWYALVARYGAFDELIDATRAMDPEGWAALRDG